MTNSLMMIFPYKYEEMWVFDDKVTGLEKEPFICGIPEMIDIIVCDINNAEQGFKLVFSQQPFPEYKVKLKWKREQYGGHWYSWERMDREGWLCPALFRYFDIVPPTIYCDARPLP